MPHSGLEVPQEILDNLTATHQQFLPNQDWHLDHLYDFLPELGIAMLKANYSRYVVDLNRPLREPLFGSFWQSPIARQTAFKVDLYAQEPDNRAIARRIEVYYRPYHERLHNLIQTLREKHGRVLLLDLHSFASGLEADVCLGTRGGSTANDATLKKLQAAFEEEKFACVTNQVFNGGHITQHYAEMEGVETIQIELHYRAYLDPHQLGRIQIPDWNVTALTTTRQRLRRVMQKLIAQA